MPTGIAVKRKMRSFQTTGDDDPRPGISTFHLMFLVSLHSIGGFAVRDTPVMSGPRHCAQFFGSPTEAWRETVQTRRATKARRIRMFQILTRIQGCLPQQSA
jgi:hypothetical protein